MKRKTLKNKSCYVMILMLSSVLFLTGLTGCKSREAQFLIERTRLSFFQDIKNAKAGNRLFDISGAIEDFACL